MTRDTTPTVEETVDARGLECPQPVLLARAALARIRPHHLVEVLATDPHAVLDFEAFCARTGHVLVNLDEGVGPVFRFVLRRRAD